jgi:TonB family protein
LSKAEVLELVSRSVPGRAVADAVRSYGIGFEPTAEVLDEFRKAGADDVVIKAMRDSWRPESTRPLSDKDILLLLAGDVRSDKIVNVVQQRGIAFKLTDEYLQRLRVSGAKDELVEALRTSAAKPFSRDVLLQWLAGGQDSGQIAKAVQERGIDFDPSAEDLAKLRGAGASESLLQAIREARRVKPLVNQLANPPEATSPSPTGTNAARGAMGALVICPPSVASVPVFARPDDMRTTVAHLECGDRVSILEKDSGRVGVDKILATDGMRGFVQASYLSSGYVTPPVPTYKPEPRYAPKARRDRIEGSVTLRIVIDSQGNVTDAREISKPLGGGLDDNAIETVRTWKFQPATLEGVPVPVRVTVVVTFRIYR